jgi:tRNA U55 pseudouridine synthase TruB
MLVPVEIIAKIMPIIEIRQEALEKIRHGSPIFKEFIKDYHKFNKSDFIAIMHSNKLLGIAQAEVSSSEIEKSNLIAKPKTVLN